MKGQRNPIIHYSLFFLQFIKKLDNSLILGTHYSLFIIFFTYYSLFIIKRAITY